MKNTGNHDAVHMGWRRSKTNGRPFRKVGIGGTPNYPYNRDQFLMEITAFKKFRRQFKFKPHAKNHE